MKKTMKSKNLAWKGIPEMAMASISSTREARFWQRQEGDMVKCLLCPHFCHIAAGRSGRCLVRYNDHGTLMARAYGRITSIALDPIEKKPLYYYCPGSQVLSIGSYGCNLDCSFCQNWTIARREAENELLEPADLVRLAQKYKSQGNIGIAYTYNEPLINWEYVYDCARMIKAVNLKNILVTNGFINAEPLAEILPYIDAMNIDLKSFSESFYHDICHGKLTPVLETIARCAAGCHVEVTTLLIPGLNDREEEVEKLAAWLASADESIPLHLTRHHPAYKLEKPDPISIERLRFLAAVARRHLTRVRLGNIGL